MTGTGDCHIPQTTVSPEEEKGLIQAQRAVEPKQNEWSEHSRDAAERNRACPADMEADY